MESHWLSIGYGLFGHAWIRSHRRRDFEPKGTLFGAFGLWLHIGSCNAIALSYIASAFDTLPASPNPI